MGCANYFKREFQLSQFNLQYDNVWDFYISSYQRNHKILPLLCIRGALFLSCLTILIFAIVMTMRSLSFGHYFLYMTNWGVITVTITTGFAFLVSCIAYIKGPIDTKLNLPWYVKTYWVLHNVGITAAFFITFAYYFALIAGLFDADAVDSVVDFLIHGMNSILMVILLLSSRVPLRILHFIHPVLFGIVYLLFSVIFYLAGGTGPSGDAYIYPALDWTNPRVPIVTALVCAVGLIIIHILAIVMAAARNALSPRLKDSSISITAPLPK